MNLEIILTVLTIILGIWDVVQWVSYRTEKIRIKAKVQVWNDFAQGLVNMSAKMEKGIDLNEIQDVKESKVGIRDMGIVANNFHVGLKKELGIKD